MPTSGSGITLADTKSQKASRRPIPWKQTMQNCVTIWHDWLANLVVFPVVLMLSNVPYVYLSSASIADNSTGNVSQTMSPMSWISWAHYFRHSAISPFPANGYMTKRFAIGFFSGLLIFLAINLTIAHLSSDCGLPAVFGRDACADDIARAGWPMLFYEEGGFDFSFIFN